MFKIKILTLFVIILTVFSGCYILPFLDFPDKEATEEDSTDTDSTDTDAAKNIIKGPAHAEAFFDSNSRVIIVFWSEVKEATSYNVYYGILGEKLSYKMTILPPYPTAFKDTLSAEFGSSYFNCSDTVYCFAVTAQTPKGESEFSPPAYSKFAKD